MGFDEIEDRRAAREQHQRDDSRRTCTARDGSCGVRPVAASPLTSSISKRTSPRSRKRRFGSLSRHRCSSRRTLAGVSVGRASHSGSLPRTATMVSDTVPPLNAARPVEHFVQDASECPDVGPFVDDLAPRLLGAHVSGRAQDRACARVVRGHRRRLREVGRRGRRPRPSPGQSRGPSPRPPA